jgi:hypothetical protein
MTPPEPAPADAWARALDALEAHLLVARELAAGRSPAVPLPWSPPTGLGPLPAELVDRARALQVQQQALLAELPAVIGRTRRQLSVTKRVSDATASPHRPVYIDQTA